MRSRWLACACFLLGVVMLSPHISPGQPGGGRGGFNGFGGGKGKKGFGFTPDPERTFGFIAKNGDVIDFSRMDPNQKRFAVKMFERNGLPVPAENAVITKAQFVEAFNKAQASRGSTVGVPGGGPAGFSRGPGGGPPGGGPPSFMRGPGSGPGGSMTFQYSGGPPQFNRGQSSSDNRTPSIDLTDEKIKELFDRSDRNHDNKIDYEEASDRLRPDFKDVDTNQDGAVDATEYRVYVQKKYGGDSKKDENDRGSSEYNRGNGNDRNRDPNKKDEPVLVAIRYGKLPDGLPSWWNELDTDKDGQVGLYEWREGGRDMEEFLTMDLDRDFLLAPKEMLRYTAIKAEKDRLLAADAAAEGFEVPMSGGGGNGGRRGMGGRDNGNSGGKDSGRNNGGGGKKSGNRRDNSSGDSGKSGNPFRGQGKGGR